MRYFNKTTSRLILKRELVEPMTVTQYDYSDEDLKDPDFSIFVTNGHMRPATEKDIKKTAPVAPKDPRYILENSKNDKKVVSKKTNEVKYVVAEGDSLDNISMGDDDMVIAKDDENPSPDTIEQGIGVDADGKTGSDKVEDQLNQDHEDSSFNDDSNLADMEEDLDEVQDVDDAMREDASLFIKANGKMGAKVKSTADYVKEDVAKAVNEMNKSVAESSDDNEAANTGNSKVNELLKKPYAAKKKMISRETDKAFLKEVSGATASKNLKEIVNQRLTELK